MMRRALYALLVLLGVSAVAQAQESRASLVQQARTAYEDFAPARALDLARAALDPALGAPDTVWTRGVHLLTQVLIENGDETLARTWARWAMRMDRGMAIDSVNFLAGVVAALRQARDSVGSRSSGDEATRMAWQWPARGSTETQGRIRFDPSSMPVPVNVVVRGVGVLPAGQGLSLAPATYDIEVGAPGYLPARVSREVLPGVTLTLSFQLTSAAVVAGTIADNVRQSVYRSTAALSVTRFGAPPTCAAGAFTSGRLVLTSYAAIRGAENLSATLSGGAAAGEGIRVAAYDPGANLAVLLFPAARPDTLSLSSAVIDGQALWGVGLAQCRTPSDSRTVLNEWMQRPLGALRLSETIAQAVPGTPIVDYQGRLTGLWTTANSAIPAPAAVALLAQAQRNVAAQQTLALVEVARRERHAYGTLAIAADVTGATARLTPLESWHWAELATTGGAPLTYSGPMGRYRLELSAPGVPSRTQEVTIRPGETVRLQIPLRTVAGGPGAPPVGTVKKGGMPKWVWIAVLGGGAAAAAALGGGGSSSSGGGGGGPTTGSISVSIPVSPP